MRLSDIKKTLKNKSSAKARASAKKFVPTIQKFYGARAAVLNEIMRKIKEPDFELCEKLWQSGFFEERLLAAKILGKICPTDPKKTLRLIQKFSRDIEDWCVCDTLAMQGIRRIAAAEQKEIFKISRRLVKSKNLWQRRFALVLLINYYKDKKLEKQIRRIMKQVENDEAYYVKKAIVWLKAELGKRKIRQGK